MAPIHLFNVFLFGVCTLCDGATKNRLDFDTFDPEAYMNTSELIKYNGYTVENHDIYTSDGFILGTQRIPHGKKLHLSDDNRPVVLLQHGLNGGSDCFVMESNSSLAFILADAGMDVWLPNSRGNLYAQRNTRYSWSQDEFWAWSFDEMAILDIPAVIDYILKTTNRSKLVYIGHSQGTNIAFAAFSQNKTLADKVELLIALSPIARVTHIKGLLQWLHGLTGDHYDDIYKLLGRKYFLLNSTIGIEIATRFCTDEPAICTDVIGLICGYDFKQTNLTRTARYTAHATEGTSVQNMVHYMQEIQNGQYQMFDYGPSENMRKYNQTRPPLYNLKNVQIPTAIYYGGHDWLCDTKDLAFVKDQLPKIVRQKYFEEWDHLDYILANDAPFKLFPEIISLIKQYHTKSV